MAVYGRHGAAIAFHKSTIGLLRSELRGVELRDDTRRLAIVWIKRSKCYIARLKHLAARRVTSETPSLSALTPNDEEGE